MPDSLSGVYTHIFGRYFLAIGGFLLKCLIIREGPKFVKETPNFRYNGALRAMQRYMRVSTLFK